MISTELIIGKFLCELKLHNKFRLFILCFSLCTILLSCKNEEEYAPKADFVASPTELRVGDMVGFSDLSENIPREWFWEFGDGDTSIVQHAIHHYMFVGEFDVSLTVKNMFGTNTKLKSNYIKVNQNFDVCGEASDIDANIYSTIQIGDQCWFAENLKTTKLNDGTDIIHVTNTTDWNSMNSPAYCWYNNNPENFNTYGALYNWYTIATGQLCPEGWRVASDNDYFELEIILGISQDELEEYGWRGTNEGSKIAGEYELWTSGKLKDDEYFAYSGFNALPAGNRGSFQFTDISTNAYFWTSSSSNEENAWYRRLNFNTEKLGRQYSGIKNAYSVRCVKE
jgi:uncharacterized protein (TIGR02145 family)